MCHDFSIDINKSALIVGNGPSASLVDYRGVPSDLLIFRMNMFFLEDNYYYGRSVDGFFCAVRSKVIESYLSQNLQSQQYNISTYFTPLKHEYENEVQCLNCSGKIVDHWEILARKPEIAVEMMKRPLPTQGLQALATLLVLGFRRIHIVGMDFYQTTDIRYHFDIPEYIRKEMPQKDYRPGYERGAHNFEKDLHSYGILKNAFPSAQIFSLSENSFFSQLAPLSPLLKSNNVLFSTKDSNYVICLEDEPSSVKERVKKLVRYLVSLRFFRKYVDWLREQL